MIRSQSNTLLWKLTIIDMLLYFFQCFRPWLKEFVMFDCKFGFYMSKSSPGCLPEVWKPDICDLTCFSDFVWIWFSVFLLFVWFLRVLEGSKRCGKTCSLHPVTAVCLNEFVVPSYDRETNKVHEYWIHEYQNLSVSLIRGLRTYNLPDKANQNLQNACNWTIYGNYTAPQYDKKCANFTQGLEFS